MNVMRCKKVKTTIPMSPVSQYMTAVKGKHFKLKFNLISIKNH